MPLNEPQKLPDSWGPILGVSGFIDRLGDLSWLGPEYKDMGWFVVGEVNSTPPAQLTPKDLIWEKAKDFLQKSDWAVLPDVPLTVAQRAAWVEYRQALRDIKLQPEYPDNIIWPKIPE